MEIHYKEVKGMTISELAVGTLVFSDTKRGREYGIVFENCPEKRYFYIYDGKVDEVDDFWRHLLNLGSRRWDKEAAVEVDDFWEYLLDFGFRKNRA